MDDLAMVVKWSGRIEWLLKEHYRADGNNIEELIASSLERLPPSAYDRLKFIASIKNQALKIDGYQLDNPEHFLIECKKCERVLQPRSAKVVWRFVLFLIFAVTAGALWFYAENWQVIVGS